MLGDEEWNFPEDDANYSDDGFENEASPSPKKSNAKPPSDAKSAA